MASGGTDEEMLKQVNALKVEKSRLEEKLKEARSTRMRKEAYLASLRRKRAAQSKKVALRKERVNMLKHRVGQQQVQLADYRKEVQKKKEAIKQHNATVR